MTKFWAAEPHVAGTTRYEAGDEREADEHEVQHLVELGVLSTTEVERPKALGAAPANKAEGKAPANKAG